MAKLADTDIYGTLNLHGNDSTGLGDLLPNSDDAYDIGASGNEWKDIYIDGTGYFDAIAMHGTLVGQAIVPSASDTYDLGSTSQEWQDIFIGTGRLWFYTDQGENIRSDGTNLIFQAGGVDKWQIADSFIPSTADTYNLGNANNEVANLYLGTGKYYMYTDQNEWMYSNGTRVVIGVGGADGYHFGTDADGFYPNTADAFDLGLATNEWSTLYIGDAGGILFGLDQDAGVSWSNANSWLQFTTDNGSATQLGRMWITSGVVNASIVIRDSSSFVPQTDGGVDLGTTGVRWGTTYSDSLVLTNALPLAYGGTGAVLADPGADRVGFWDDSAGAFTWLTMGDNLTITDTTLAATGGVEFPFTESITWDAANTYNVGSATAEVLNMYLGTGKYFMYNDQYEWMYSDGSSILWGVANANEMGLSGTALYPTTDSGLDLGIQTTNEWKDGWFSGDVTATAFNGTVYYG